MQLDNPRRDRSESENDSAVSISISDRNRIGVENFGANISLSMPSEPAAKDQTFPKGLKLTEKRRA